MNKNAKKAHSYFINGKINADVFMYIQKNAICDVDDFDDMLNEISVLNIKDANECREYIRCYSCAPVSLKYIINKSINDKYNHKIAKYAFVNKNNYDFSIQHNWIKMALDFIKNSYPNNGGVESEPITQPEYDINKWIETMRYIYDTANTNNYPFDSIVEQVISKWNNDEKICFKRWMRYYQEGNANKYNVKTAQFFINRENVPEKQDIFTPVVKPDSAAEKSKRLEDARRKLRGRLKSVLELLDQYRDVLSRMDNDAMRKDVYDLNEKVWNLELKASIVDSIMRTSNQFNKRGFIEGAAQLKKIAQEVVEDKMPEIEPGTELETAVSNPPPPSLKDEVAPVKPSEFVNKQVATDIIPETATTEVVETAEPANKINIPDVDATKGNIEVPDFNDISYREALKKLEEINGVISERAIVRALAGVDIILAQLGIASYFTGLSESQSKLLDAFNYSSTRISDVISQLRGRRLSEVKDEEKEKKDEKEGKSHKDIVETAEEFNKPVQQVENKIPPRLPKIKV